MRNKYGIDTDKAMDEMSPPQNKSGKLKKMPKDGHKAGHHSPHSPKMDHESVKYSPMPYKKK